MFYDVGVNVGMYTCFAGQFIEDENGIAFEPHPANVDRLRENASINDVQADVRPLALSNERGSSEIAVSEENDHPGVRRIPHRPMRATNSDYCKSLPL